MPMLQQLLKRPCRTPSRSGASARPSSQLLEACRQYSQPVQTLGKQLVPPDMRVQDLGQSKVELLELMTGATTGAVTSTPCWIVSRRQRSTMWCASAYVSRTCRHPHAIGHVTKGVRPSDGSES